jgi:hypothetical protein
MASLNSPFHVRLCAGLAIALGTLLPQTAARAQSEGGYDLFVVVIEAINSVTVENAREAHAKCLGASKEAADRKDLDDFQRLYLEAKISKCISYAMNKGRYSDATGDACSHMFGYATKMNQTVKLLEGQGEFAGLMPELKSNLREAIISGQSENCEQDFEALRMK